MKGTDQGATNNLTREVHSVNVPGSSHATDNRLLQETKRFHPFHHQLHTSMTRFAARVCGELSRVLLGPNGVLYVLRQR
jgi:hypothetical protein